MRYMVCCECATTHCYHKKQFSIFKKWKKKNEEAETKKCVDHFSIMFLGKISVPYFVWRDHSIVTRRYTTFKWLHRSYFICDVVEWVSKFISHVCVGEYVREIKCEPQYGILWIVFDVINSATGWYGIFLFQ